MTQFHAAERTDRQGYQHFLAIPTRWADHDSFGHVNNAVYYSWFDTAITHYLMHAAGYDLAVAPIINVTAETMCRFRKAVTFPQVIEAGVRVGKLGRTSVRYEMGLFVGRDFDPAAVGHVLDVFVDRVTMRPVPIPDQVRNSLRRLLPRAQVQADDSVRTS